MQCVKHEEKSTVFSKWVQLHYCTKEPSNYVFLYNIDKQFIWISSIRYKFFIIIAWFHPIFQ